MHGGLRGSNYWAMDQTKATVCVFVVVLSLLAAVQPTYSSTSPTGCDEGRFSVKGGCEECSTHCNRGLCDVTNGSCLDGCIQGFYGQTCQHPCPDNCLYDVCDIETGFCKLGCSDGFYGNLCDLTCGVKCNRNKCRRDSGYCSAGCVPRYYGYSCDTVCNEHCKLTCDRTTGACDACVDGYHGTNCTETCSSGCKTHKCRQDSGECWDGCRTGWVGPQCAACPRGFYGINCTSPCNKNCLDDLLCDAVNGTCLTGCKHGFQGELCSREVVLTGESGELPVILGAAVVGGLSLLLLILVIVLVLIKRKRMQRNKDFRNRELGNESKSQITRMDKVMMWNDRAEDGGVTSSTDNTDRNYENSDIQIVDPKPQGSSDHSSLNTEKETPASGEGENSGQSDNCVNLDNEAPISTKMGKSDEEN